MACHPCAVLSRCSHVCLLRLCISNDSWIFRSVLMFATSVRIFIDDPMFASSVWMTNMRTAKNIDIDVANMGTVRNIHESFASTHRYSTFNYSEVAFKYRRKRATSGQLYITVCLLYVTVWLSVTCLCVYFPLFSFLLATSVQLILAVSICATSICR